jgi:hypothetical protein
MAENWTNNLDKLEKNTIIEIALKSQEQVIIDAVTQLLTLTKLIHSEEINEQIAFHNHILNFKTNYSYRT